MAVRVQRDDFDVSAELAALTGSNTAIGGVASFVGVVRGSRGGGAMTLEHYPGMTEKELALIEAEAHRRWPLESSLIIHRHGRLQPGEKIVLVAAASAHRRAALEACAFLIDWLKTRAPFWKKQEHASGSAWVEAKKSDEEAAAQWEDS